MPCSWHNSCWYLSTHTWEHMLKKKRCRLKQNYSTLTGTSCRRGIQEWIQHERVMKKLNSGSNFQSYVCPQCSNCVFSLFSLCLSGSVRFLRHRLCLVQMAIVADDKDIRGFWCHVRPLPVGLLRSFPDLLPDIWSTSPCFWWQPKGKTLSLLDNLRLGKVHINNGKRGKKGRRNPSIIELLLSKQLTRWGLSEEDG